MWARVYKLVAASFVPLILMTPNLSLAQSKEGAIKLEQKSVDLRLALRDLWGDHIFWVRNVVLTTKLGDKNAAKAAEEQVVENSKAIGNAIVPFYGRGAGDKLFTLLAGHYGSIKDYMNAAFSGGNAAMDAAKTKMIINAQDIAAFLSSANPNWPKEALLSALGSHGALHMAQIEEINAKNFKAKAKTWVQEKAQVFQIAGVLAEGIVKQFPERFALRPSSPRLDGEAA